MTMMEESSYSKLENNTFEQRSNDDDHNNDNDNDDNNNVNESVASSSSSSSIIEVLTTLEIVQTLKRIPFLKRNLVSIRQRQVLFQQHPTNSFSINDVSRSQEASSSASLPVATLPSQTNSDRNDDERQQRQQPQQQQQQQQQQSVSSKSSKKKRSSSPSPQVPFIAPPLHHEYDDDQAKSCQVIQFTKIFNVVDEQQSVNDNNTANANLQHLQPMFVEESYLLILNDDDDDDDSQQDLNNQCPFCSHKLPTSIEAILKHCRRFHGDHHEFTTKVLVNRDTPQQQQRPTKSNRQNQKKQPNVLEEGMIHIIAKPIGCRKINLDNAQLRSFYTMPRRRWWASQNSIPKQLVEEKEQIIKKQQHNEHLAKKLKLDHNSSNGHHHSIAQTQCVTSCNHDDDDATLELRRYRHQEAVNHHKNQQQQRRILLRQRRQEERFKPHLPKKLLEEGRSSSSGSSSTTSSSSASSGFIPQRRYYHSMSRIPMAQYDWEVDSDDLSQDEWRNEFDAGQISGYLDVTDAEKEFLILWNRFIRRDTVLSDFEMPTLCLKFIRRNATAKLRHLRQQLLMHLTTLWEYQQVSSEHIVDLMNEYDSLVQRKKHNSDSDRKMPSRRSTDGRKLPTPSIPSTTSVLSEPDNGNTANTTNNISAAAATTSNGTPNKSSSLAAAVAAAAAAVTASAAAAAKKYKAAAATTATRTSSSQPFESRAVVAKVSPQWGAGEQQAVTSVAPLMATATTTGAMISQQGLPTEVVAPPTASKPGAATPDTSLQRAVPGAVTALAATVMHSASRSAATTAEQRGELSVVTESTTGSPTPTTADNGSMKGVNQPVVAPSELESSSSTNGNKIGVKSSMEAHVETIEAPLDKSSCPQHILNYIATAARSEIVSVEPCKSAQQQVWIVSLSFCPSLNGTNVIKTVDDEENDNSISLEWKQALQRGRNKVVVRLWKAGARWWNLHQNDSERNDNPTLSLAQFEVDGYRIARLAFTKNGDGDQLGRTTHSAYIPRVLEYREFGTNDIEPEQGATVRRYCWAIIEYVGPHSTLFCNGDGKSISNDVCCHHDDSFVTGMVKTRSEFGFDEPHPRWGRVPVEFALDYALMILRDVMIPLHCQTSILLLEQQHLGGTGNDHWDHKPDRKALKFQDMVKLYKYSLHIRIRPVWITKYQHQGIQGPDEERNEKMESIINHLGQALNDMEQYTSNTHRVCGISSNGTNNTRLAHYKNPIPWIIPPLDPVLVHMDLQPQNLLLARRRKHEDNICCSMQSEFVLSTSDMVVQSVLDWEDSATADPRFDLLMVCRKVCANREQADILWKEYQKMRMTAVDTSDSMVLELGPIEPWLQLETAHSLITLLLQSMDLLGGGRNPWETKKDLWGKLEREYNRLKQHSFQPVAESPVMTTQVEMGSPRNGENMGDASTTIASESHSR